MGKTAFALMVAFVLVSLGRAGVVGQLRRQKAAALFDEFRRRGQPVTWADMKPPPIPDDQNAVEVYRRILADPEFCQAMDLTVLPKPSPPAPPATAPSTAASSGKAPQEFRLVSGPVADSNAEKLCNMLCDDEFRRAHPEWARQFLSLIRRPLATARQARGRRADFKIDFTQPQWKVRIDDLAKFTRMAYALRTAALVAHDQGDDATAVEYLRNSRAVGEALYSVPLLVGQMVAVSNDSILASTVESIAPTFAIGRMPTSANPEEVRALIADLVNTRSAHKNLARAMTAERTLAYEFQKAVFSGQGVNALADLASSPDHREFNPPFLVPLVRSVSGPLWTLQATEHARFMDQLVADAQAGSYSGAVARERTWPSSPVPYGQLNPLRQVCHFLTHMFKPDFERGFVINYRGLAMRRMAAVALAVRLHEAEHGKRPATLADSARPSFRQFRKIRSIPATAASSTSRASSIRFSIATDAILRITVGATPPDAVESRSPWIGWTSPSF